MIPPSAVESGGELWRGLTDRIKAQWQTKMAANVLGLWAFFWVYFWVLRHPLFPPFEMPLTALDHWIGFSPAAILLYVSLWVYLSIPLALLKRTSDLLSFGVAAVTIAVVGLTIFVAWPTTTPVSNVVWSQHPGTAFLKGVDASGNACPSLHVAFAVFAAAWLHRVLHEMGAGPATKTVNWLWCAAILYSTVATRQHVVLDVVAGAALGASVVAATLRWLPAGTSQPNAIQLADSDRQTGPRQQEHFANSGFSGTDVSD